MTPSACTFAIASYTRPARPVAWPGQETLAERLGCSVDTIQRHGKLLVETGWLLRTRRGRGRTNLYHLRMPNPVEIPVDDAVDDDVIKNQEAADLRLQETADLRLPIEEEQVEEETPPTPRKRGAGRGRKATLPLSPQERAGDFDTWWDSYPRKQSKLTAIEAWRKVLHLIPSIDQLVIASERLEKRVSDEHPNAPEWRRFLPLPATWLNGGRWEDDIKPDRPDVRPPCLVCGVDKPNVERCLGVGKGIISDTGACPWASS